MAIQKHNTYYDASKPNSGIYYYDTNGKSTKLPVENICKAGKGIKLENNTISYSGKDEPVLTTVQGQGLSATSAASGNHTVWTLTLTAEPVVTDTNLSGYNGIKTEQVTSAQWNISLENDYKDAIEQVSGKLDKSYSSNFYPMEGNPSGFLTEHQSLDDYAKSAWVNDNYQKKGEYLSANSLDNLSGNWENTYNTVSAYSSDFAYWKNEYETVTANSGNWNDVSSKLDTDVFTNASGAFALKDEVETELAKKQDASGMSAYATSSWVDDNYQAKGDYVTTASFEDYKTEVEQEFSNTSSWANDTFLKEHQSLEDYYKKNEVDTKFTETSSWANETFQSAGNYLTADALNGYSASWNETSATVKTNSANWDNGYEGYNWISDNSANIVDASATLFNNSGNWEHAYTDVTTLATKSADWNEVSAKVNISDISAESANWNEAYNWTTNNSANIVNASATFETNSGKWENSYTVLTSTSAAWNALSASKLDTSAFEEWSANADVTEYSGVSPIGINEHKVSIDLSEYYKKTETSGKEELNARFEPIEADLDILKENSAHNVVESKNDYIKVYSGTNKFELEFLSGDLADKPWVTDAIEAALADFGGFESANPTGDDNHPDVVNPSNKKIYLVADTTVPEPDKSREWIVTGQAPNTGWYCIGDTSLDLTPYIKISDISAASATWNNAYNWVYNNSANIVEASGAIKEVSSTFTSYSGKWNDTSASLFNNSSNWNSVYDTVGSNSSKWENSYTALTSKSADWNEVSAKLNASESAKYMFLSDLKGTEDGKLSGYGSSAFYYPEIPEYSGKDGIKVEDYWITISADYLTANALDELSGKWEQSYTALTATSAKWDSVYTSVNENSASWNETSATVKDNSAKWNEASAFSANSGKFVTSALTDFTPGLAHVLTKDENNNVAWSGIDLSDLGKMYPITSLTPDLVSATISAVDGTSAYVLSAASAAEIPNISGISGISAYFDAEENKYIVGLKDYNAIGFAKFITSANVYTGTNVFDGYSQALNLNPEKIALDTDKIVLQPGLYHVDLQCLMAVTGNDNNYYTTVISTIPAAASITQMIDASYAHEETIDLSFDIRITQDDTALDISVDGFQAGGTYTITNLNIHEIISMPSQIQGGANNYQAGDAIDITNDTLSVKFDSASGIGLNANGQLVVKLGKGLTFDTSGAAAGQLSIDDVTEEVVETVQTITNDLDEKVTSNFPPAMITKTNCDIAEYRGVGALYGNLFNVSINSVVEIDRTMLGVYIYQIDNDKNVILGLYEYQPDYPRYNNEDPNQGISGYGRTVALCDTGVITIPQGTVGFCEYPVKNLNNTIGTVNAETRASLKSSCMYYATIFMGSDMNSNGLCLAGVPNGYGPQINNIKPGLNVYNDNYNLTLNDASYSAQISFNDFGFGWKYDNYPNHYTQGDTTTAALTYQEKNEGARFYMQIRNKPQTSNI